MLLFKAKEQEVDGPYKKGIYTLTCWSSGCEISTGPGTNASEMLVGPVKNFKLSYINRLFRLAAIRASEKKS